jgi:predicted small metal-binding protein
LDEETMNKPPMADEPMRLRCACGWETSGTEDEVVAAAAQHGEQVHNMRPTRDEVLAMVVHTRGRAAP